MQFSVFNKTGEEIERIELDDYVFGVGMNQAAVHQAIVRQRANARVGTASTKTRGEVEGSTRKLFRQKHTGMARAGSSRSPLRRHGGIVWGPHPRDYRQAMPKKMRRLALRCVLSSKAADGSLVLIDNFGIEQPSTKGMKSALAALGVNSSALVVTAKADMNVVKSARNIEGKKTLPADLLNVGDLTSHRTLVMTVDAVRRAEELWGKKTEAVRVGTQGV